MKYIPFIFAIIILLLDTNMCLGQNVNDHMNELMIQSDSVSSVVKKQFIKTQKYNPLVSRRINIVWNKLLIDSTYFEISDDTVQRMKWKYNDLYLNQLRLKSKISENKFYYSLKNDIYLNFSHEITQIDLDSMTVETFTYYQNKINGMLFHEISKDNIFNQFYYCTDMKIFLIYLVGANGMEYGVCDADLVYINGKIYVLDRIEKLKKDNPNIFKSIRIDEKAIESALLYRTLTTK